MTFKRTAVAVDRASAYWLGVNALERDVSHVLAPGQSPVTRTGAVILSGIFHPAALVWRLRQGSTSVGTHDGRILRRQEKWSWWRMNDLIGCTVENLLQPLAIGYLLGGMVM